MIEFVDSHIVYGRRHDESLAAISEGRVARDQDPCLVRVASVDFGDLLLLMRCEGSHAILVEGVEMGFHGYLVLAHAARLLAT